MHKCVNTPLITKHLLSGHGSYCQNTRQVGFFKTTLAFPAKEIDSRKSLEVRNNIFV